MQWMQPLYVCCPPLLLPRRQSTLTSINMGSTNMYKSIFILASTKLNEMDVSTRYAQEQERIKEFVHGFY